MEAFLVRAETELFVVAGFVDQNGVTGIQNFDVRVDHGSIHVWKQAHGVAQELSQKAITSYQNALDKRGLHAGQTLKSIIDSGQTISSAWCWTAMPLSER